MSERQVPEAAGYIVSVVRKQRQVNTSVPHLFSADIVQDSSQGLIPPTVGLISVNAIRMTLTLKRGYR